MVSSSKTNDSSWRRYNYCDCISQAIVKEGLKNVAAGAIQWI
jgi:hypothetical protein